jgi:AcrR family transcriptional regulator
MAASKLLLVAKATVHSLCWDAQSRKSLEGTTLEPTPAPAPVNRRARRRAETIEEILRLALEIMGEVGVGGLTFAELARRLGVQPPSLYKYFDSVLSIYDELFQRGHREHLEAVQTAMSEADPGVPAILAGMQAGGVWTTQHPTLAQLLFWRPVPGFEPSPDAFAPSLTMVGLFRQALHDAAQSGQINADLASEETLGLLSVIAAGVRSQYLANEPGTPTAKSRFLTLIPRAVTSILAPTDHRFRASLGAKKT